MKIKKVISGGQTGVDRGALDAALESGIPIGGWCPHARRAEDGEIPAKYPLQETEGATYVHRTELNIRDSDATLVLTWGPPTGGTRLTVVLAKNLDKPCLLVDLDSDSTPDQVIHWLEDQRVTCLNVAGPRASKYPQIYEAAHGFLREVFLAQGD